MTTESVKTCGNCHKRKAMNKHSKYCGACLSALGKRRMANSDPTPTEIAERTAEIREEWTEHEEAIRSGQNQVGDLFQHRLRRPPI